MTDILFITLFIATFITIAFFVREIFVSQSDTSDVIEVIDVDIPENHIDHFVYYPIDEFIKLCDDDLWDEFKQDCMNNSVYHSWEETLQYYNKNISYYSDKLDKCLDLYK